MRDALTTKARRREAFWMLTACTALWGLSFPTMKALTLLQGSLLEDSSSWFFASLCVAYRFGLSGLALLVLALPGLKRLSASEVRHGGGIGLFGGLGILLQMDGLAHTSASTSAFLTQCYSLFIPLWVSLRARRRPSAPVLLGCALVMCGVAVLSGFDWSTLRMGRGELETILAAVMFAGQILWLERPCYAGNDLFRFSMVSFFVMALCGLPTAVLTAPRAGALLDAYASPAAVVFLGILVIPCTLGAYMLMNRWQRHVSAVHAGLIYCMEPVFASAVALFLPAWLSRLAGIPYSNETLTSQMVVGGGLIIAANVLIQIAPVLRPADSGRGPSVSAV